MGKLLAKEQSKAVLVGDICQTIIKAVLEAKLKEGLIKNIRTEEPVIEIEAAQGEVEKEERQSGNFVLDFSFERVSDAQLISIWVSHRAKSDNSHTYFWGLVDEVRQVRKRAPDAICIFIILGNKRGWKDWIFPASLLFFDYTFFVGDLRGDNLFNFKFENCKELEEIVKERLIVVETEDIDAIVQDLLNNGFSPSHIKKIVSATLSGKISKNKYASRILDIYETLKEHFSVQAFSHNEFVTQFYKEIQKLSKTTKSPRSISTSIHRTGILEATCYLYVLLFEHAKKEEVIRILSQFYDDYGLARKACDSLIDKRIIVEKNSMLEVNPEIAAVLIKSIENMKGGPCTHDDLVAEFAYKMIVPKLSKAQLQALEEMGRKHLLAKGIDNVLETIQELIRGNSRILRITKSTLKSLYDVLKNRRYIIKRREEILSKFLSILDKEGIIDRDSIFIRVVKDVKVDQNKYIFLHNLTSRTDLYDPYVLFLNKEYRERIVKNAYSKLKEVWRTNSLLQVIEKQEENGLRIFFEVAIYAVGETPTTIRNVTETAVASTGIWAFLRGDKDLPSEVKQSINEFFKSRKIINDWKTISEEIFRKRIQQIKRNSRINILEELVYYSLLQAGFIFLGTPETQGDVYLRSMLSEVGLKCFISSSTGGKVEKRGEDFVVPTSSGVCIAIQCRASPQSYEARRMAGHSLQFVVKWVDNKWVLRENLLHVAVVDGSWKEEWIENLLDAGYDIVFSAEEVDKLVEYLEKRGAIKLQSSEYLKKLREFQLYFRAKEVTPDEIINQANKILSNS